MENLEMVEVSELLHKNPKYFDDKTNLIRILEKYNSATNDELHEMFEVVVESARSKDWSRRKLDCLLDEIIHEKGRSFSDNLSNYILDFLDAIEGNVNLTSIVRLNGDPDDLKTLGYYVRSYKWRNEDKYSK